MRNETIFNSLMRRKKYYIETESPTMYFLKKNFNWRWKCRRVMIEVCHRTWLCWIKISNLLLLYNIANNETFQSPFNCKHWKTCFISTLSSFFLCTSQNVDDVHTVLEVHPHSHYDSKWLSTAVAPSIAINTSHIIHTQKITS